MKAAMQMHSLFQARISVLVASSIVWILFVTAPAPAESNVAGQSIIAVSGIVTGNVQEVGFRAMIQKQAIRYNLAGSAKNDPDKSVHFLLQGIEDRIDQALKAIRKGTKKSSNVKVSISPAPVEPGLETFTVFGWTSVSRHISHPYDPVFNLRHDNTTISKDEAKRFGWVYAGRPHRAKTRTNVKRTIIDYFRLASRPQIPLAALRRTTQL